jgi:NADH dehydrogenase
MMAGRVGQVVPLYVSLGNEAQVQRATEGADIVVNLVGILSERRPGDFDRVQAEGAGRIARSAASHGVGRMVQVSAIGADAASPSAYARSKAAGEHAVLAALPGATILRPSLVFGAEDKFFNRFGSMAMMLPVMPVISGDTRFQPVFVGDVADAVLSALGRDDARGRTYELGGPRVWTFREILAWILKETKRRRPLVEVPMGLARLQARLGELVPGKPFTRDQLVLLGRDNVVSPGMPGLAELGIVPTPVELVVPEYLNRYRTGGGKREEVPT